MQSGCILFYCYIKNTPEYMVPDSVVIVIV